MSAENPIVGKPGPLVHDLTEQRFGRLTVISFAGRKWRNACWLCRCDCGAEKIIKASALQKAKQPTTSCGCYQKEAVAIRARTHGHTSKSTGVQEFHVWRGMIDRCTNADGDNYKNYGARGISVCDRWLNSFEQFYADMGPRPSAKHEIDRIDNDGPYSPENCKWSTRREQSRNRRTNRLLTLNGVTLCVEEWAERLGVKNALIHGRLRSGWSAERALTEPRKLQSSGGR